MPLAFEVVFVDKIVGNDRRTIVEWVSLLADPNLNQIMKNGRDKICKFLDCKSTDLVFRSIKLI